MNDQQYIMPGRQVTVFLFLFNLAQWIVFTFEIQKVRASRVEEGEVFFEQKAAGSVLKYEFIYL